LTTGYIFVIIAISIVVTGGIIMVYVMPSITFRQETGFISSEDAKKIINLDLTHMHLLDTTFVLLRYHTKTMRASMLHYTVQIHILKKWQEKVQKYLFFVIHVDGKVNLIYMLGLLKYQRVEVHLSILSMLELVNLLEYGIRVQYVC